MGSAKNLLVYSGTNYLQPAHGGFWGFIKIECQSCPAIRCPGHPKLTKQAEKNPSIH